MSRWPVAGPSEYWFLASSPASKVKNSKAHLTHVCVAWMLRVRGAIPLLPHILSWCEQGQFYLYLSVKRRHIDLLHTKSTELLLIVELYWHFQLSAWVRKSICWWLWNWKSKKIFRNHVLVETYVCVRCTAAVIPKLCAAAPVGAAGYFKIPGYSKWLSGF